MQPWMMILGGVRPAIACLQPRQCPHWVRRDWVPNIEVDLLHIRTLKIPTYCRKGQENGKSGNFRCRPAAPKSWVGRIATLSTWSFVAFHINSRAICPSRRIEVAIRQLVCKVTAPFNQLPCTSFLCVQSKEMQKVQSNSNILYIQTC